MPKRGHTLEPDIRGLHPVKQYEKVRWGNKPKRATHVEAHGMTLRQDLVELGRLRSVFLITPSGVVEIRAPRPYPHLAFGEKDNKIYIVGGCVETLARAKKWGPVGSSREIKRIDYEANKGGEFVYWYHDHERPYPRWKILPGGFPVYSGGQYRVTAAGIEG